MKGYFSLHINKNRFTFVLWDMIVLLASITAAYLFRYGIFLRRLPAMPAEKILIYYLILLPQVALVFYIFGLYDRRGTDNFSRTLPKLIISMAALGMVNGLFFYFQKSIYIGRMVFVIHFLLFFILSLAVKLLLILRMRKEKTRPQLFLINISREEKEMLGNEPDIHEDYAFVELDFQKEEELDAFIRILDDNAIIVVSSSSEFVDRHIHRFISLKFNRFNVYDMKTFYVNVTGKIPQSSFGEIWTIMSENEFVMGIRSYYRMKRVVDIGLSLVGLVLSLPFFLVLPLLIKLTSRGPVFFVQERLGWNKKPFNLVKFRTMKVDAEKDSGPRWASENDPRITALGKFMRKTRLDELPQLFNVAMGQMSVVGTRPIRQHFAGILAKEIPYYDLRFFIKPGLTGWSQVKYDYAGTVEGQIEKFKYELFYIKNMSFMLDMVILLKTVKTVFGLNGS